MTEADKINKGIYKCTNGTTFAVVGIAVAPSFNTMVVIIRKAGILEIETIEEFNSKLNTEYEYIGFD